MDTYLAPFPHFILTGIFPPDIYKALDRDWPADDLFTTSVDGRKHDLRQDRYDELPEVWKELVHGWRPELGKMSAEVLKVESPGRANYGRLMIRDGGYVLEPHLDASHYTVTCLLYFPSPGQEDSCGTRLYVPHFPLLEKSGRTQYFWKQGISCPLAKQIPFTPNTLLAFANGPTAAHGLVVPAGERRRVFQFHMSHKDDDSL